jgi:hypothetical protein
MGRGKDDESQTHVHKERKERACSRSDMSDCNTGRKHSVYFRILTINSGKWLIHCRLDLVDSIWECVRKALLEGNLDKSAKVSTRWPGESRHVLCVYVDDFSSMSFSNNLDIESMYKVLTHLMEVVGVEVTAFKLDLFTHLGIYSREGRSNEWGLSGGLFTPYQFCDKYGLSYPIVMTKDHTTLTTASPSTSTIRASPSPGSSDTLDPIAVSGAERSSGNQSRMNQETSMKSSKMEFEDTDLERAIEESKKQKARKMREEREMREVIKMSMTDK